MPTLTFPTIAEQAVVEWNKRKAVKTTSFNTIAKEFDAFRDDEFGQIVWVFPDETTAHCRRGRNYTITTYLP